LSREPDFDELIGPEATGEERERLRHAHELLVQAGPPPELSPSLRKAPSFGGFSLHQRRIVKRRTLVLLAAALSVAVVFVAGYAVGHNRSGSGSATPQPPTLLALTGTRAAPNARATLAVWQARNGNWPMRLSVAGLPKLPGHTYYEVYLVRHGKPWGQCGSFRIASTSPGAVTLTFNAPYSLEKGDSWIVTRPGATGAEPGQTVLRPVSA
jgi:Anti-sigma-K factor rskA, C-terminal